MKKLIVVLGLPGCGKDIVALVIKAQGIPVYGLGDVVRKEVRRRGLPITKEIQEDVAKDMRMKHGMDIFARLLGKALAKEQAPVICINGPRTLDEVEYLGQYGNVVTVEIVADEQKRFERCKKRGNQWDPKTIEDLRMREKSNL
jgi:dephospho-CoA kinase